MTTPLNYSPSHSAVYYTPPARLSVGRMIIGLAIAVVAIAIGSFTYATVLPNLHTLIIRTGAVVIAAIAVGLLALIPIQYGKVRSPLVAVFIGAGLALFSLYVMWLVWVHNVLEYNRLRIGYAELIAHPGWFFRIIRQINAMGTWSYHGGTSRGLSLLFFWLGEAGLVLAAGVLIPIHKLFTDDPICADCGSRCVRVKNLPRFDAKEQPAFVAAVESRDFAALASHPAVGNEDDPELALRLMSCPRCGQTHVLTINQIAWHIVQGRRTVKTTPLIHQLLITPAEAGELKAICEEVQKARAAGTNPTDEDEKA